MEVDAHLMHVVALNPILCISKEVEKCVWANKLENLELGEEELTL